MLHRPQLFRCLERINNHRIKPDRLVTLALHALLLQIGRILDRVHDNRLQTQLPELVNNTSLIPERVDKEDVSVQPRRQAFHY